MYKNYNTAQTSIALNLNFDIPNNHIARLIDMFVETIPHNIIETSVATTGRPAYHPAMLIKMLWSPVNKIDNLNRDFFVLCHD